jgi:hypothetical protein
MGQLMNMQERERLPISFFQCLADLAKAKAKAVLDCLTYYRIEMTQNESGQVAQGEIRHRIRELCTLLDQLAATGDLYDRAGTWSRLASVWRRVDWPLARLERSISICALSQRTAVIRAGRIEDILMRSAPVDARIQLHVTARDSKCFSALKMVTEPHDYSYLEILGSRWWRSVTAEALLTRQAAYAYMVWQHASSTTLHDLLIDARSQGPPGPRRAPASSRPSGDRWIRWLDRLAAEAAVNEPAENRPANTAIRLARPEKGFSDDVASAHAHAQDNPATLLAMIRSGTVSQSLNFVLFHDQPEAGWVAKDNVFPVGLDPDRPIVVESAGDVVEIFVGLPRTTGLLITADHPVSALLRYAEDLRLSVIEIQLPAPCPSRAYDNYQWARIRATAGDSAGLARYLDKVYEHFHEDRFNGCIVGIRATPGGSLRFTGPRPGAASGLAPVKGQRLVVASDIDAVAISRTRPDDTSDDRTWRTLAICADACHGIGNKILRRLDPRLRLAGLSYTVLHGKAIMLLLGHGLSMAQGHDEILAIDLARDLAAANVEVLVDSWQSTAELGVAGPDPLLRVRISLPIWPGTMLCVADSLREALLPSASPQDEYPSVWCVRAIPAAGNILIRLVLRLPPSMYWVRELGGAGLEKLERRIRMLTAVKMAAAPGISSSDIIALEDISVRVEFVAAPLIGMLTEILPSNLGDGTRPDDP